MLDTQMKTMNLKSKIPGVLWEAIITLAASIFASLFLALKQGSTAVPVAAACAVLNLVQLWGVVSGRKWAYVLTIELDAFGIVINLTMSWRLSPVSTTVAFLTNVLILAPVLMTTRYFFPAHRAA